MSLRELKVRRTRDAIARVALDLFTDRGYEQVTIEEIAAGAEVAPSTVYRHFASKERLVLHFARGGLDAVLARLHDAPDQTPIPEVLASALVDGLGTFDESGDTDRALLVQDLIEKNPMVRAIMHDEIADFRNQITDEMVHRMPSLAQTLAPSLIGALVTSVYELAIESWRSSGGRTPPRRIAAEAIQMLAAGGLPLPTGLTPDR